MENHIFLKTHYKWQCSIVFCMLTRGYGILMYLGEYLASFGIGTDILEQAAFESKIESKDGIAKYGGFSMVFLNQFVSLIGMSKTSPRSVGFWISRVFSIPQKSERRCFLKKNKFLETFEKIWGR